MKWNRYDIYTTTAATDIICATLSELGINGFEIKDNKGLTEEELDGMFAEIPPVLPADDGKAVISFYLDADRPEDNRLKVDELKTALSAIKENIDAGTCEIEESVTQDTDWVNNWKKYWHTFKINDLYIKPTWEEETAGMKDGKVISLDPGTAFGTGAHETTRLVIGELQELVMPGDCVLDIGCGSGILSIVSVLYGAEKVLGIDLDKNAIKASYKNCKENHIDDKKVEFLRGDIISDPEFKERCGYSCYDIVCANILPVVLVPLTETVDQHMKSGAFLIYSGILNEKLTEVTDAINKNHALEIVDTKTDGEWSSVRIRKK